MSEYCEGKQDHKQEQLEGKQTKSKEKLPRQNMKVKEKRGTNKNSRVLVNENRYNNRDVGHV